MKRRLHSYLQVTHNTNHPSDVVNQQPCNRRARFFAVSVLVLGLTAQLIARYVWADFADSAPTPVSSFHPQVSYNDPQKKPFEITGIDPGKIVREQNGP